MPTMKRKDYDAELAAWLEEVKAEQAGGRRMRFITIPNNADRDTLDAAIITLRAKQSRAVIASTAEEIGDVIDELLEMRLRLPCESL